MSNFKLNYTHPWLLLLIIPALALALIPYFRVQKKYRRTRNRVLSVVFHSLAMFLAINLLAGISFSYELPNTENEVIILVDASDSGEEREAEKNEFIESVVNVCGKDFKIGIVKFGFDQKYVSELSTDTEEVLRKYLDSENPDTSATDIESALKYASGLFTNPHTAKIVVISDGIETDNAATSVIKSIAADGIKVDAVSFPNAEKNEIQIVSAKSPDETIRLGEKFAIDLLFRSNLGTSEQDLLLKVYDNGTAVGTLDVTVNKQEVVVPVELTVNERGMHEIKFELTTKNDSLKQNNSYNMYVNLETFDNILIIERYENESEKLQGILSGEYNVTSLSIEADLADIPKDIYAMAEYEEIILVNIAYGDMPAGFEALLNEYVYDLGGGLFTVGGQNETDANGKLVPHAYNREDLSNSTFYKQMLPINALDFTPPIAVMIVVDTSASMSTSLEAALEGSIACLDALSDRDFCGVMTFQTTATEELKILPVSNKEAILETIKNIGNTTPGGNTVFSDAIMKAGRALSVIDNVERKHIILVSDGAAGDPYETYLEYIEDNVADDITMSVVTVNIQSEDVEEMTNAATAGGGKFYNVTKAEINKLPEVMQNDLALEAIAEIEYGEEFLLSIKDRSPVLAGITEESIPPLTGYYGTVAKQSATVPLMAKYVPMYANWKYGAGNVGSFMSDLNGIWSDAFVSDLVGRAIITNIVESLFPSTDVKVKDIGYEAKTDNYTTSLNIYGVAETDKISVEVTPLSEHLSDLRDEGIKVLAKESNRRFSYVIKDSGLYEIKITKSDADGNFLSDAVFYQTFSYSEEYNAFPEKEPIGEELLATLAKDGRGAMISDATEIFNSFEKTYKMTFDPRIIFLILTIIFVLLDIAVRKFKFKWPHELIRERKMKKADNNSDSN